VFGSAFLDHLTRVANSDGERVRRWGNSLQETKNQRSETIKRRSRDMHVIIIVAAPGRITIRLPSKSRRGTRTARTSALPASPLLADRNLIVRFFASILGG
jgi:hypothetical protein